MLTDDEDRIRPLRILRKLASTLVDLKKVVTTYCNRNVAEGLSRFEEAVNGRAV